MIHEKLKEAFLQGEEKEAANLFRQLLRQSIRAGLLEAMAEEVEALCGPRYRPYPESLYHRTGSETGVAYMMAAGRKSCVPRAPPRNPERGWPPIANCIHSKTA